MDIEVSDEGMGINQRVDVFAPFQRGDDEATRAVPGVGLGLHIVRNLVEAMSGQVSAHANEDGGSTFVVRLPAAG